jgi:D-tyrosyl-tRNA(Tyr) deacylase
MTEGDTEEKADLLIRKCVGMRIFSDENDKMNLSVKDIDGEILVEPNFTLYANIRRGNRPDFFGAMNPNDANKLFEYFKKKLKESYPKVSFGVFGADMHTQVNMDGPVTIVADTGELS